MGGTTTAVRLLTYTGKILFILGFVGLAACAASTAPPPIAADDEPEFAAEYRIGAGDTLTVNVWRNADLSINVPVRPDGKISVPLAGDVDVGNKTPEEVAAAITKRLAVYIRDPYVTVIVTDMGSELYRNRVRVTGAVENPVSLPYRQGMTVLDLVLEAGGVTDFANTSRAMLYREGGETIKLHLDRVLKRGDMSTNYPLRKGDTITIPERAF